MRSTLFLIVALALGGGAALADDGTGVPSGTFLGHDGNLWRMEGCAAIPVEPRAGAQSKPAAVADNATATALRPLARMSGSKSVLPVSAAPRDASPAK